jgi:hypothetical protein
MSRGLQWVIAICAVLLVAAVIFGIVAPFFLPRVAVSAAGIAPGMGRWHGFGSGGVGPMFHRPGMMGFGFPFLGGAMILGPLVIVGLVVVVAAILLNGRRQPVQVPPPAEPAAPASATTPCAHCGQPLQAGWKACPYCGEKV